MAKQARRLHRVAVFVVEATGAYRAVAFVAVDHDLRAFFHAPALGVDRHVERGFAPAGADGLHLFRIVGQRQQNGGTREGLAAEVAADTVANHRHRVLVRQAVQLAHLLRAEKLRVVYQQASHTWAQKAKLKTVSDPKVSARRARPSLEPMTPTPVRSSRAAVNKRT